MMVVVVVFSFLLLFLFVFKASVNTHLTHANIEGPSAEDSLVPVPQMLSVEVRDGQAPVGRRLAFCAC